MLASGGPSRSPAAPQVRRPCLTAPGPRPSRRNVPRSPLRCRSSPPTSAASSPMSPACTCSATAAARSSTSARRSRSASASPRTSPGGRVRLRGGDGLVGMIDHIEALVVQTESEALLAEQNFIKQYKPRFNIRLRDDKSYPYIAISLDEDFPRVYFTRERHRRDRAYFGPYSNAKRVRVDARRARQGVHVPLLRGARARPPQRLAVPGLLHQALRGALRRLRQQGGLPARDRRRDRLPVRPLPRDRARARPLDADGRGRAAIRGRRPRAQPPAGRPLAAGAPAGVQRGRGDARCDRGRGPRERGQRPGVPGPRRGPLGPAELLPRQRARAAASPKSPRRSSCSTTATR